MCRTSREAIHQGESSTRTRPRAQKRSDYQFVSSTPIDHTTAVSSTSLTRVSPVLSSLARHCSHSALRPPSACARFGTLLVKQRATSNMDVVVDGWNWALKEMLDDSGMSARLRGSAIASCGWFLLLPTSVLVNLIVFPYYRNVMDNADKIRWDLRIVRCVRQPRVGCRCPA